MVREVRFTQRDLKSNPPQVSAEGRRLSVVDYFRLDKLSLTQQSVDLGIKDRKFAYYFDPKVSPYARTSTGAHEFNDRQNRNSANPWLQDLTNTRRYGFQLSAPSEPGVNKIPGARTYSGSDIKAVMVLPGYGPDAVQAGFRELGELQTVSISTMRTLSPVRRLGEVTARSYARGRRTISGTLIFALLNQDVLAEYMDASQSSYLETEFDTRPTHFDQMPPFHIILNAVNEVPLEVDVQQHSVEAAKRVSLINKRAQLYMRQAELESLITAHNLRIDALTPLVESRQADLEEFEITVKPFQLGFILNEANEAYAVALSQSENPFITDDFTLRRDEGHIWRATYLKQKYDLTTYNPVTKTWDLPDESTILTNVEALIGPPGEQVPQYSDIQSGLSLYSDLSDQFKSEYDGFRSDWLNKNVLLGGYKFWEEKAVEFDRIQTNKENNEEQIQRLNRETWDADTERADELGNATDEFNYYKLNDEWLLYEIDPSLLALRVTEGNLIKTEANRLEDPQAYLELNYHGSLGQLNYNQRMYDQLTAEFSSVIDQISTLDAQINETIVPADPGQAQIATGSLVLYNIHLFATGTTFSIHDIYTEVMYQYIAEYMKPFKSKISALNFTVPTISTADVERLSNRASNFVKYENIGGDRAREDFVRLPGREE